MQMQSVASTDIINELDLDTEKICPDCGKPYKHIKSIARTRGIFIPDCECAQKKAQAIEDRKNSFKRYKDLKTRYKEAGFPIIMRGFRLFPTYMPKYKKTRGGLSCEHHEEAENFVNFFKPKRAKGFHYVGKVGNGKTTLAVCIGKELIKKGYRVKFMTFSQCMRILQSTYGNKNPLSFDEQMASFLRIDLLILDDFGRDGYKEQKLADAFEFLNALYNNRNNVILTSNPEMIEKVKAIPDFGAMLDRFHKMAKFREFKRTSYRREGV